MHSFLLDLREAIETISLTSDISIMLMTLEVFLYGLKALDPSEVIFLGWDLHTTGGYFHIWHVKVVLCHFGDSLGREYPRDKVFSDHFNHFCVQLAWNKISVRGRLRSDTGKTEAKNRTKFCMSTTL